MAELTASDLARQLASRPRPGRHTITCRRCGKEVKAKLGTIYCSQACNSAARRARYRDQLTAEATAGVVTPKG